jgi:hypothetical protein
MSSQSQILANQANAKLSTGPSTPEGKSIASRNATKHGLASGFAILPDESQAEFDQSLESYCRDFKPTNAHEEFLVAQMVQSKWKLARTNRMETEMVSLMMAADPEHKTSTAVIAAAMLKGTAKPYQTLQRYAAAAERAYFKALRQLQNGREPKRAANPDAAADQMLAAAYAQAAVAPQKALVPNEADLSEPVKPEPPFFAAAPRPKISLPAGFRLR